MTGDSFDNWLANRTPEPIAEDGRLAEGTIVDGYRIRALLGRGGFAEVYRATDAEGVEVAIKMLHRLEEKSRLRFERESRILARIHHPNIPRLVGFGSYGDRPYVVTELLQPCELPHDDHKVAVFLRKIISAVAELHARGYVHRDIKPANILQRPDGEPVLIDFGLVAPISAVQREQEALSVEGGERIAVGTVGYSAPEQFSGQAAGREADVHALGAMIGECFGVRMPQCWRKIYLMATNSNPRTRYSSVLHLLRAIRRRHWGRLLIFFVGALLTGLIVAASVYLLREKPSGRDAFELPEGVPESFDVKLPVS